MSSSQVRPCHMHVTNEGITDHLLRSTAFAIHSFLETHAPNDATYHRWMRLVRTKWSDNMRSLRLNRDVTGLFYSEYITSLPETWLKSVAKGGQKPKKLKGFEYKDISFVSGFFQPTIQQISPLMSRRQF